MNKKTIAILFGGCSEEHAVSIKSAVEIAKHIDTQKYDPVYIGITRSGRWMQCERPCLAWEQKAWGPVVISPDQQTHGLLLMQDGNCQTLHIDAAFPVLHGRTGEDGAIQGLLELAGIPYVGCGVQSSVSCMDKTLAYLLLKNTGIATPAFQVIRRGDGPGIKVPSYPVFVKPARSGSSFGVTKVNQETKLAAAIKLAGQYDSKIVIEQAIGGTEVGCAILGSPPALTVGEVDQISLKNGFFRIHQEDHPEEGSENAVITVPADLPAEMRRKIQETAKAIYTALGCTGLARVDLFLQEDGTLVFNEVNTLPGFTCYSRYPRMMAAAGLSLSEVIDRAIALALEGCSV